MIVIPVLRGGVGNCLFGVATAMSYALKHGIEYSFPVFVDSPHNGWTPALQFRNVPYIWLTKNELKGNIQTYKEPFFHYQEIPKYDCDYLFLDGYFQSSNYMDANKKEILHILGFDNIQTKEDTCSIHYRSGDYNNLPNIHPKITEDYLKSAISYMWFENYKKFMVFSDNIPEIKEIISSFPMYKDLEFEYSEGKTEIEDLKEMASCSGNIISNSSYSWWAQYINPNENKIIVAPRIWFGKDMNHNTSDLYLPYWVVI